jgi:hypothetical protein
LCVMARPRFARGNGDDKRLRTENPKKIRLISPDFDAENGHFDTVNWVCQGKPGRMPGSVIRLA